MIGFVGVRSLLTVAIAGIAGILLAGVEILLSACIIKLLSLIGFGEAEAGVMHSFFSEIEGPFYVLAVFVIVSIFRAILYVAKGYCAISANELFVTRLRFICISSTLNKVGPKYNSSRVYSLVSDVFLKSALTFYGFASAIPLIIQSGILLAFLLSLSIYLSFASLSFIFLTGLGVYLIQRHIALVAHPLSIINDKLYGSLKRVLDNLLLIRFCKLEKLEQSHVANLLEDYLSRVKKSNLLGLISENIPLFLGTIVVAILFSMQLIMTDVSPELFITFVYVLIRLVQALSQVVNFLSTAIINVPYFKSAFRYYNELPETAGESFAITKHNNPESSGKLAVQSYCHTVPDNDLAEPPAIYVSGLNYGYDKKNYIFDSLTFNVCSGKQCVIVGSSGAGKSTLLNLLVGELEPMAGEVLIGGKTPNRFLDKYSHAAAYAGPTPLLFEGSIRENMIYGVNRKVSDSEIRKTLTQLGMDNWLADFDGDLSVILGPEGIGTSSGQAQRLSIARALLRNPKLLILDEVTSNLDSFSENLVLDLLESLKGDVTIILVTHSNHMMEKADTIIDLDVGEKGK